MKNNNNRRVNMRKIILGCALIFLAADIYAQDSNWKLKGMFGGTYNETDVSGNWTGPEKNQMNWGIKLDASAEKDLAKTNWLTNLKEEYGKSSISGTSEQVSADLIDLISVYSWKLTLTVNPYVSADITTQNTDMFYPATYSEAAGLGFSVIKREKQTLKTRIGISLRQKYDKVRTLINSSTGLPYDTSSVDDPATPVIETSKMETGGEWISNYDLTVNANVKFSSEARVFSAFNGGASLRWDNNLYIQLSKYMTLAIGHLTIFNYDRLPRPTWPQDIETRFNLALGVSYNLF
jgi:hypothetical protein